MPFRAIGLRRPTRSIRRSFQPRCVVLEARTLLATVTWINPAGGDWDTPSNWSTGTVPGPSDDAVIGLAGVSVTHSSSAADSVNSLTISASDATLDLSNGSLAVSANSSIAGDLTIQGGTLSAAGTLAVTGSIAWSGGTLNATGTVDAEGGMAITGGTLSGGTLNNHGTATLSGSVGVGGGATINNLAGASFAVQSDVSLGYGGGALATFNNDAGATFAVSNDGNGGTQANVLFNNAGAVDVNSGGLTVGFSYANSVLGSATSSGSFYGAPGTSLVFGVVSQDFTPTSSIDAANVGFVVGSFDVEGSYAASGQTHLDVGAGVNFTGTVTSVGSALDITPSNANASANFSPATPVTLTTNECTLTGTLTGTDSFVITGPLILSGGTLSTTGTTDVYGGMTITGGGLGYGTLINHGAASLSGSVGISDGGTFNNAAGATLSITGAAGFGYGGGAMGAVDNAGAITIAGGFHWSVPLDSTGPVAVTSGWLGLDAGGSFTGSASLTGAAGTSIGTDGSFAFGPGTAISVDSISFDEYGGSYGGYGPTDVGGSFAVSGQTVLQAGAHVTFTGPVSFGPTSALDIVPSNGNASADFSPATPVTLTVGECRLTGTLTGSDSFVIDGPLTLSGGTLSTTGTVDAEGGMTITGGNLSGGTLNNHGTASLSGTIGVGDGATINNLGGAIFDIQGDTSLGYSGGAFATLNNSGVLLKSSSTGVSHVQANVVNTGKVEIQSGTLSLGEGAPLGTVNSGDVIVAAGAMLNAAPYVQNGGSTVLSGGTIAGGPFNINSGILSGSGTINANVTGAGQVVPGGSGAAGTLTINGNYTQTTAGTLDIDLGGTTAGSQYDQLAVTGAASLTGSLDVALINGFRPAVGNTFLVLSFGSTSGAFTTFNGPNLGGGLFLNPAFSPSNLTLDTDQVAISGAPAFPLQGIPINLTGSVTGPSGGDFPSSAFSWTVILNGDPYQSGSGTSFSFTPTASGTYLVTLTVADSAGGTGTITLPIVVIPSIYVLNATASGALTLSGNASINIPGLVVVDSSSKNAVSAAGNAQVTAAAIDVIGGVQQAGAAAFHPAPTTGVASVSDPLGGLATPGISGMTYYGSVKLGGNSQQTLSPGIYSQISVSGGADLMMNPGIYIIEGGGFTITGNASVAGSGVMIYNAGSNYPSSGGNFGGITLSGTGSFGLTAPTSGPYAGILFFQSRENTRALSFSGDAMGGMTGVIYAANALLSMSGNASLQNPLDVGMLNLSGNVALTQAAAGSGGSGDATGLPDTLVAGDLSVYVNDTAGQFTADEVARIQDAIDTWDALLVPYNVTITEVGDSSLANLVIDTGITSACGGAADGVLGCYNAPNGEITMLQGWNWYAGADPSQIGADEYDFQTMVTHELGHALGLGHSPDPASPMYESLAAGVADRTPTTQDLNIPDPPDGADPQMAADVHHILPAAHPVPATPPSNTEPIGMMPLGAGTAGHDAVLNRWHSPHRAATRSDRVPASGRSSIGHHARQVGQPSAPLPRHRLVDRAIEVIGALRPVPDLDATGPAAQPPRVRLM